MDLLKFFEGQEPMYYDLGLDRDNHPVLYVNSVMSKYVPSDDPGKLFRRAIEYDFHEMEAWVIEFPVCENRCGRKFEPDHGKAYETCSRLCRLLNDLNYVMDKQEQEAILLHNSGLKQSIWIDPGGNPDLPHSNYSISGWVSNNFVHWFQGINEQRLTRAEVAGGLAFKQMMPSIKAGNKDRIRVVVGDEPCFLVSFDYLSGTSFSTRCDNRHRLDSGNMHTAFDLFVALSAFAAICDMLREEGNKS